MGNVVITGANRGIGLELAKQYAQGGDRVFAFCRSPAGAEALNAAAAESGGKLSVHAMDVGDPASITAGAAALGDTPVDVLINNAGVVGGPKQGLEDIDFDAWVDAFKIMTIGPLRVVQAFLKNLRAASGAKIMTTPANLNMTSRSASHHATIGLPASPASEHAMANTTENAAIWSTSPSAMAWKTLVGKMCRMVSTTSCGLACWMVLSLLTSPVSVTPAPGWMTLTRKSPTARASPLSTSK